MHQNTQPLVNSNAGLWIGRIISAWVVLFLAFDGGVKVLKLAPAVEATAQMGYPVNLVAIIGVIELGCLAVYLIPRTFVLGAILLTGFLGGAIASKVRLEDPWFLFPAAVAILVWAGLVLRHRQLRALVLWQPSLN